MYTLRELAHKDSITMSCQAEINGKWVPARGENYKFDSYWLRLKDAWAVFTRKADAFTWPEGQ